MEAKLNELTKIVELKKEQGDRQSLDEARYIEDLITDVLRRARQSLTKYGRQVIEERLAN